MSFPRASRASLALRSSLRSSYKPILSPSSSASPAAQFQLQSQRRWKSTAPKDTNIDGSWSPKKPKDYTEKPKDGERDDRPFHFQMWDSVSARVEREKARQDRLVSEINTDSQGRILAFTIPLIGGCIIAFFAGMMTVREKETHSTTQIIEVDSPILDNSRRTLEAAWADFKDILGEEHISMVRPDLEAHAGSAWSTHPFDPEVLHFCVLRPSTTQEVAEIMQVCNRRKIPVTPYSGGTSLEGHFTPTRGGVCIDFSRMDKILAIHKDDLDVVVQPAVGWEELNEVLSRRNLFFPPDPGPGAKIGGMVGTGCSGTNAYRYGTMKDWVLSLTVVMADGTIIRTRQRPRKSSAGYDLTRVFVGSEGTLGIVTEAVLKVTVKPQHTSVAVTAFKSVRDAAACVSRVVQSGVPIAAIEILDDVQMKCINDAGVTSKHWREEPTLFFKFAGTQASVAEQIAQVQALAKKSGSQSFEFAKNQVEQDELWSARKEALWSVMAKMKDPENDHVWTTDVAVPISRLPAIIEETKEDIKKSGLMGSIVGHVGDGNFHAIILYNSSQKATVKGVVHRMVKRAIQMEGTATGEHGVGLVKRDYLDYELGEDTVDAMRRLKLAFDPQCILNPDKVVRMELPAKGERVSW